MGEFPQRPYYELRGETKEYKGIIAGRSIAVLKGREESPGNTGHRAS